MIYVIGVSYSIEYAIKGLYENTIGRVFEWIRGEQAHARRTIYARAVLQDYAAFLYTVPWYKYPFRDKLNGFMAISTPTPSTARTIERGFALRQRICRQDRLRRADPEGARCHQRRRAARHHVRGRRPCRRTCWRASRASSRSARSRRQWQLVQTPRYKDFTDIVLGLLDRGIAIAEIAGNREILVTVMRPRSVKPIVKDATRAVLARPRRTTGLPPRRA